MELSEGQPMNGTRLWEIRCSLGGLVGELCLGRIGQSNNKRPFVPANATVRDLFKSMSQGYAWRSLTRDCVVASERVAQQQAAATPGCTDDGSGRVGDGVSGAGTPLAPDRLTTGESS